MPEQPISPSVSFSCSNCGKPIQVPARQVGREIACPHCRAALLVPEPVADRAAPSAAMETVEGGGRVEVEQTASMAEPRMEEPKVQSAVGDPPMVATAQTIVEARNVVMPRTVQLSRDEVSGGPPRRRYAQPPAKSNPKKWVIVAVAAIAVLAVAGVVGFNVKRNMDRAEKTNFLLTELGNAQRQFEDGELEKAAKHGEAVRRWSRELAELGGQLTPDQQKKSDEVLKQIKDYQDRLQEVAKREGELEANLEGVRSQLRDLRTLLTPKGRQARPIVLRIEQVLARADELERERKIAEFRKQIEAADTTWMKGDPASTREQVAALRTRMAADEQLKDAELEKRLDHLRDLDEKLTRARWIRANVNDDFPGTRQKLNELALKLKSSEPAEKVILAQIDSLKAELDREEKTRLKLSDDDLKKLRRVAEMLSKRDVMLQVDEASPTKGVLLRYEDQNLRLIGLEKEQEEERLLFNVSGYRFRFPAGITQFQPGVAIRIMQSLSKGLREAGGDGSARWEVQPEAPAPLAWMNDGGKVNVFYSGKLYEAEAFAPPLAEQEHRKALADAAEALAQRIEKDEAVSERVRGPLVTLVRGAYKELDEHDYLPGAFCRRVLDDGYVELNVPGAATRYKTELENYRKAYQPFENFSFQFKGTRKDGDEVAREINLEGYSMLRHYDAKADRTIFGLEHPVKDAQWMDRPLLFVVYEFAGKQATYPEKEQPLAVRMVHPAVGVMASYDPGSGKLDYDATRWAQGAEATTFPGIQAHFGTPEWAFPPHVVLTGTDGSVKALVTPAGRVDLPNFPKIADLAERRKAQDAYLDQLAKVLNTTGLLHLYFLYFHQYVLDSPIETQTTLLGSRAHGGDIHQNVYQSLDRRLGGRYLGDCDDLAELYMNVTRRQGKLSYVMSLPGHAACGWVEKDGNLYRMQFLDTGPPRIVEGDNLEKVVEAGSRTYDREKTMRFDPKSVPFLFRFAGEPTRTPYWLSCRMFYDRAYAEIMERVQSYWHFHVYALGIKTMEDMIAKGDKVPENCVELAGLYGRVREFKKSIKWTNEALAQLGPDDVLSRMSETARVGMMYREAQDYEGAYKAIEPALRDLLELSFPKNQQWMRFISQRMEYSGLLVSIHKPWHAWELFLTDLRGLGSQRRRIFIEMAAVMANILYEMKKQEQEPGRQLTDGEKLAMKQVDGVLNAFFKGMCFTDEDDFNDNLRNYAFMGRYYGGKLGSAKLTEELLKDGPFPEKERNHQDRNADNLDLDWQWIRMSPLSYTLALGDAIDPDDPPEKWRKDEAIKLAVAMERAADHARKFGSLSSNEFMLLSTRVMHACMVKDWKEFEGVLKEVKERNFARLTASVAETFGRSARFLTPDEFAAQYKVFSNYVDTRAPYFNVVYEAYRNQAYEHARRAAQLAVQHWPDDENMKREAQFLDELIRNRQKEKGTQ